MGLGLWTCFNQVRAPAGQIAYYSITFLLEDMMYVVLCLGFTSVHVGYSLGESHTSIIVPCANSLWYKAHTIFFIALALAAFVVGSIETVQYPRGASLSVPPIDCRNATCGINETFWIEQSDKLWQDFLANYNNWKL